MITRRVFLQATAAGVAWGVAAVGSRAAGVSRGDVMTVLGPITPDQLGLTLAHEHAVVDFIGAEKAKGARHDANEAFETILPHFKNLKERGCRALVECTPNYIGRDVRLLKRLSSASGLHILTNTGYYGAAGNKFLPRHAFTESADQLAERWLGEWRDGIEGSGIRPGFIKLGVEKGKLSDLHTKLVRAAARVHLQSGLAIAIHTGDGAAALDELRILSEEKVNAAALIWVHAQNDPAVHAEVARRGAWVSLDGVNDKNWERYKDFLTTLKAQNLLGRVLLSHDHFWSVEGEGTVSLKLRAGGSTNAFQTVFTRLLPGLRDAGFAESEINQLLVKNPAEAFALRLRRA